MLAGAIAVAIATSSLQELPLLAVLLAPFGNYISGEKALYSPLAYFCLLSLVAVLELRVPARRQPLLTPGVFQDTVWYAGSLLFRITFLGAWSAMLYGLYHRHLDFLTIESAADWHPLARFTAAVLVTDFARWLGHLIAHKVPLFWQFHAVHHSQRNLNLFTDARVHPVDRMVAGTIKFVPLLMFDNVFPVIMAWAVFETVYPKFYHANVRLNFGPLRYLLVTPQSHRVHHGVDPEFRDRNFGFTFSLWDRIFGTQHPDHNVYPETGIDDQSYPHEVAAGPLALLKTFIAQLIYPFRKIVPLQRR